MAVDRFGRMTSVSLEYNLTSEFSSTNSAISFVPCRTCRGGGGTSDVTTVAEAEGCGGGDSPLRDAEKVVTRRRTFENK